jgi:hypothetical protein
MANKSPNNPKEFVLPNGNAPPSIIVIVGFSSIGRFITTKFTFQFS